MVWASQIVMRRLALADAAPWSMNMWRGERGEAQSLSGIDSAPAGAICARAAGAGAIDRSECRNPAWWAMAAGQGDGENPAAFCRPSL